MPKPKPYRVVSVTLYPRDIRTIDAKVRQLKARGHTKMSRSALIRQAVRQLDINNVPEQA